MRASFIWSAGGAVFASRATRRLLAHLDAENAQEAKAQVREHLPPEGDYAVDEPVQID
jgi:hypothetical protein